MIKIIVIVLILLAALLGGSILLKNQGNLSTSGQQSQQPTFHQPQNRENSGGYGFKTPFYDKDGISLQNYWPGEGSFSSEETEVLLLNQSSSNLEVKSFELVYTLGGKTYPHKSGTWEKFATKESWERIEYINISSQYYQLQPLILARGEKGKLHWHIQFGDNPLDGKQTVTVKLTLLKGDQTITIDEQFNRDSGTVVSKGEH